MFFERAKPLLIIDSHSILHSLRFTGRKYYTGGEEYTLTQSFFMAIEKLAETLYTDRIVFAWDSPVNKRKQEFSFYKSGREPKDQSDTDKQYDNLCFKQFRLLRDNILPYIGFPCYMVEGYEADDIIASIVMNNKTSMIFVTTDADMYQLLPYARMYDYRHKQIYTDEWFKSSCGFSASEWWKVKAYAGCTSDTVPGIPGIGEKTAIAYLNGKLLPKHKKYRDISNGEYDDIIRRNERIVRLPYEGCPAITIPKTETAPSFSKFHQIVAYYSLWNYKKEDKLAAIRKTLNMGE